MHDQNRTLTQDWKECIAACFRCAQTCEECGDDMIGWKKRRHAIDGAVHPTLSRVCGRVRHGRSLDEPRVPDGRSPMPILRRIVRCLR